MKPSLPLVPRLTPYIPLPSVVRHTPSVYEGWSAVSKAVPAASSASEPPTITAYTWTYPQASIFASSSPFHGLPPPRQPPPPRLQSHVPPPAVAWNDYLRMV